MLAIFYGGDRIKAGKAASDFIVKQKVNETIIFDEVSVSLESLLSYAEQAALFGGKKLIKCDGVFENEEVAEAILNNSERLEDFSKSPNVFVFLESGIDAETKKKLAKYAERIEEFKAPKKIEKFNIFSLSDALARRDKKSLWVLYTKALRAGKSAEEISGTLFWQMKTLAILRSGGGKTISPFVVGKNKSNLNYWSEEDIFDFSYKLVETYHKARRGLGEIETSLERLILLV